MFSLVLSACNAAGLKRHKGFCDKEELVFAVLMQEDSVAHCLKAEVFTIRRGQIQMVVRWVKAECGPFHLLPSTTSICPLQMPLPTYRSRVASRFGCASSSYAAPCCLHDDAPVRELALLDLGDSLSNCTVARAQAFQCCRALVCCLTM